MNEYWILKNEYWMNNIEWIRKYYPYFYTVNSMLDSISHSEYSQFDLNTVFTNQMSLKAFS